MAAPKNATDPRPLEQTLWLVACCFGSFLAFVAIYLVPMKRLSQRLGQYQQNRQLCMLATHRQALIAWRIANTMRRVAKVVPWPCRCLSQVLCVKWLLNRYQIPCVVFLGATFESPDDASMHAHAWIGVGRYTVIGGPIHKRYQVAATFISPAVSAEC